MSYANVVAVGTTSPAPTVEEPITQDVSKSEPIESTPEPIEVESNEEDSKTQNQLPSPNPSPKAEKKQKEVNLAPAPVPSVSAWGSASSSRSNSNVDTRHWPSPHELDAQSTINGAPKKINQVKSSKEKWVPFKASVTLPQPGSKKPNGQKRNSNKNNNVLNNSNTNKPAHNDAKKRKNKTEKRVNGSSNSNEQKEVTKAEVKAEESKQESTKSEQSQDQTKPEASSSAQSSSSSSSEKSQSINNSQHQSNNHQSNNHYNNHHHNSHHNNTRFQANNQYPQQVFIPFQPFPIQNAFPVPNGQRPFRPYNNRRFNKYQNGGYQNNGQYRQNNSFYYQNNRRNVAHLNKSSEPLLSLIKQIEYYFSMENLLKDIFLRKQMNNEGWLELTVISSFYRMSVLSAGDFQLVRRAIDELNGELLELAEFGDEKTLKVRVKENPESWVLTADQREARGLDETPLVNIIEPIVDDLAEVEAEIAAEIEAEKETKEEAPVTEAEATN